MYSMDFLEVDQKPISSGLKSAKSVFQVYLKILHSFF